MHQSLPNKGVCTDSRLAVFYRQLLFVMVLLFALPVAAEPLLLDWDTQSWQPEGIVNLSESFLVGGRDVVVTYGGNVAGLDQDPTTTGVSPALSNTNTGGLTPPELSLVIGTDYIDRADPQVTVTMDFSNYKNGVSNVSFQIFDVDALASFIDEVEITAVTPTGVVNPTTLISSLNNTTTSPNTAIGLLGQPVPPTSPNGNLTIGFAQTNISQVTVVYRNPVPPSVPDPGFQWINIHDVSFERLFADISVTKDVSNDTPTVGDDVTYTIVIANAGPDEGTLLELTDQLPAGLTYVSDTGGGAYDSTTGIWDVGSLAVGASQTLQITATVNATGPYDNIAELTAAFADDIDSVPGNNDPNEDDQDNALIVPIDQTADLMLTKIVNTIEPLIGETINYTITVTNDGPNPTDDVTVLELLPSGLSYVSDTPSIGSYDVTTGVWTIGAMAVGAVETLQISAQILATGDYANTAEIATSLQPDPDSTPGNNDPTEDDQDSLIVTPLSIGLAKSVSTGPINNGNGTFSFSYSIRVQNYGQADLSNLQVVDDLSTTFAGATSFAVNGISSTTLTTNAAYDGNADQNLLTGVDTLAIGESGIIVVDITVTTGANLGPYNNVATGTGNGPGGTPVTDDSQLGVNPDPDNDGDPSDNSDPTPISFGEAPLIGLAKRVSSAPISNGDGSATLSYILRVENFGDVVLSELQIIDDLSLTFGAADSYTLDSISSNDFSVNVGYDGITDTNMLDGTDQLGLNQSGELVVTVTVTPGANLGPYMNTATTNALSPAGTPVSDISTDGVSADPDNDGDPGNNMTPTPVSFGENPIIGTFKQLSAGPVNDGNGNFDLTFTIGVENLGDVVLTQVQITDSLATTFAGATSFEVLGVMSNDFTLNSSYTGNGNTDLLTGTDTLAIGARGSVTIDVRVTPGVNSGPYENSALGSGVSPVGTPVQDMSQDGLNPDPDNDGDPTNNNTPTPVNFAENPGIGIAKAVNGEPISNNNGAFTVTYVMQVQNYGDVVINGVQVTDDLSTTFAQASSFVVNAVQSMQFTVDGTYDGQNNINLLSGIDNLAVGASGSIQVTVTVIPGSFGGPYLNTAIATGTSPGGDPVEDISTNGTDPDPTQDGNPRNDEEPTPVNFALPEIVVTKRAEPTHTTVGGLVRYTVTVENTGGSALDNITLQDVIPPGFTYAQGSEQFNGNGTITVNGQRPVNFIGIDLGAGDIATVTYILRVGAGVIQGDYDNIVSPLFQGTVVGNTATARVRITSDPDFEDTTIIGRVFSDHNQNGIPDQGEEGIAGVRLGTVEGLIIETDSNGRYHIAGVKGGRADRGRNFIVKVDPATLPKGSVFTTENPRVKRISQGLLSKFDFGVHVPPGPDKLQRVKVKLAEVFFLENSDRVDPKFYPTLQEFAELLTKHGGGVLYIDGNAKPCTVQDPQRTYSETQTLSYTFTPHFGTRKAVLTEQDRRNLDQELASWRDARNVSILSIGHTDNVRIAPENRPEFADNLVLSKARADAVASYVQSSLGLDTDSLQTIGRGFDEPVASNNSFDGRAQNRRVELVLSGQRMTQRIEQGASRACDSDLADRRARRVYETLEPMLGKDLINKVEVLSHPPRY